MSRWRNKTVDELVGVLVFVFLLSIAFIGTRAALVAGMTDVMSRAATAAESNHDLSFVTPSGVAEGKTVTVTFPAAWSAVGLTADDIDLADNGMQLATADSCAGSAEAAAVWAGNTLSLLICPGHGGAIAPGHTVNIRIGTNAVNSGVGLHRVVNPSTPGNYFLVIGGSFGDSGTAPVAIAADDQVNVSACVGADCATTSRTSVRQTPSAALVHAPVPPVISGIHIDRASFSMVHLSWTTDQLANSFILYGVGTPQNIVGNDELTTSHSITLIGLAAGQDYNYQIRSVNMFGDIGWSAIATFSTRPALEGPAPIISDVKIVEVLADQVQISWKTNIPSYWQVEFGRTLAYGSVVKDGAFSTEHLGILGNLLGASNYHYRITAISENGRQSVSPDLTFFTFDAKPPVIYNVQTKKIGLHSLGLIWKTDKPTTSSVKYGTTTGYAGGEIVESTNFSSDHQTTLTGLVAGTTYHYDIYATDRLGNSSESGDRITKTKALGVPPNVNGLQAAVSKNNVLLTWNNPLNENFFKVAVWRKEGTYANCSGTGTPAYVGTNASFADNNMQNRHTYLYTVCSLNELGQSSSGALYNVKINAIQAATKDATNKTTTSLHLVPLNGSRNSVAVGDNRVMVTVENVPAPVVGGQIQAATLDQVGFALPSDLVAKPIDQAVLRIGNDEFAMQANAITGEYSAMTTAPAVNGDYATAVLVNYADQTSVYTKLNLRIADTGHVYVKQDSSLQPLPNAAVTILDSTGALWDGTKYDQNNPATTDATGGFGFYLPKGRYTIKIAADGFDEISDGPREYDGLVENNYTLHAAAGVVAAKSTDLAPKEKNHDIKTIYVGSGTTVVVLASLFIILIKRKKR